MKCLNCSGEMWLHYNVYTCMNCGVQVREERVIDIEKQQALDLEED